MRPNVAVPVKTSAGTRLYYALIKQLLKVGGLDLSRRDLDRDLDLDAKKKSVSTVEKISTSFKNWSRR